MLEYVRMCVSVCVFFLFMRVHAVSAILRSTHPLVRREVLDNFCRFQWSLIRYLDGRVKAALGINSLFPSFIAFRRFGGAEGEVVPRFEEVVSAWRQKFPR